MAAHAEPSLSSTGAESMCTALEFWQPAVARQAVRSAPSATKPLAHLGGVWCGRKRAPHARLGAC